MADKAPGVIPSLLAPELDETLAFYCGLLAFRQSGRYPDQGQAVWVEVTRGPSVLQFYSEAPEGTPTRPVMSGTLYLPCDDVRALAAELEGRVALEWGPAVMDYGLRELALRDPNGYLIAFTEPA